MRHYIENLNYCSDRRVLAAEATPLFENFDERTMCAEFVTEERCAYCSDHYNVECAACGGAGAAEKRELVRMKFDCCDLCSGKGTVVNPSIDCGGLTREDFDEDPGFLEDYVGGAYDITCPQCRGKRVHPVIDMKATTPELVARIQAREREEAAFQRECAAERAMGA